MKTINDYIIEKLRISANDEVYVPKLNTKELKRILRTLNVTYDEPESESDKEQYIEVRGSDAQNYHISKRFYIKIDDFCEYTDGENAIKLVYNILQREDPKAKYADLAAYNTSKKHWSYFATVAKYKRDQVWRPHWIKGLNVPFK